jgi:hypothetical protein
VKIDDNLNLVLPVSFDDQGDPALYAYHTPISQAVFEANYRVLSATKFSIFRNGIHYAADLGPRIAILRLKDEGRRDALERGDVDGEGNPLDAGVEALLTDIKRLTSILAPGPSGWQMLPVGIAIKQGKIDAADWGDAENALVFFTCGYALAKRNQRKRVAEALAGILTGSITSLPPLEYCASLPKSTKEETSASKVASSVPV